MPPARSQSALVVYCEKSPEVPLGLAEGEPEAPGAVVAPLPPEVVPLLPEVVPPLPDEPEPVVPPDVPEGLLPLELPGAPLLPLPV
jgi:hypothetical protein